MYTDENLVEKKRCRWHLDYKPLIFGMPSGFPNPLVLAKTLFFA